MALRDTPTWALRVVDEPAGLPVAALSPSSAPCCPHFKMRSTDAGSVPVCGALPLIAPIAPARARDFCRTEGYLRCPHALFAAAEAARAEAEASPSGRVTRGTIELLRDSGWVVGIPLCIVLFIVVALLLTT